MLNLTLKLNYQCNDFFVNRLSWIRWVTMRPCAWLEIMTPLTNCGGTLKLGGSDAAPPQSGGLVVPLRLK